MRVDLGNKLKFLDQIVKIILRTDTVIFSNSIKQMMMQGVEDSLQNPFMKSR